MSRPAWLPVWQRIPGSKPKRWRRVGWRRNIRPIWVRDTWGADRSDVLERQPGAWQGKVTLVVHHTVTPAARVMTMQSGIDSVRVVQRVHAHNVGGIGYHYLASAGYLFEGRGFEVVAAAAYDAASEQGWNRGPYVHVAIPGDYSSATIRPADLAAIDDLIVHLAKNGARVNRIIGHSDLMPTACPGARGRSNLAAHFGRRWKGER